MPKLFNQTYTPAELRRLTGTLDQLAGIRLVEYADGKARGLRAADVYTGSGFRFTVWLDRSMDIGPAEFAGKPLAWLHPALGTPAQYEPAGAGWLRTFGGGLMTTGGMTHIGAPDQEGGEAFGVHGRGSHLPAQAVAAHCGWNGDTYELVLEGQVRQSVLFGENLLLIRRITTKLGASSLRIDDRLINEGYQPINPMLLYHCNFGFPVVSRDTELVVDDLDVRPRDPAAAAGLGQQNTFQPPDPDYAEQVFFHQVRPGADGFATASLINRAIDFGAYVRYRTAELPILVQWKMMGAGAYIVGLEPATNPLAPRQALRQAGLLKTLAPGEEMSFAVEIGALAGNSVPAESGRNAG
ncbi:MAG TPA: aldose 1-epimerase family protein [Anaerolineaceae bacterium]